MNRNIFLIAIIYTLFITGLDAIPFQRKFRSIFYVDHILSYSLLIFLILKISDVKQAFTAIQIAAIAKGISFLVLWVVLMIFLNMF